jgi:hypothetical protein
MCLRLVAILPFVILVLGTSIACGETGQKLPPDPPEQEPSPDKQKQKEQVSPPANKKGASSGLEGAYLGITSSAELECYTFYPNGNVELRRAGAHALADSGSYQSAANGGQIHWNSGGISNVVVSGEKISIDALEVTRIQTCTP